MKTICVPLLPGKSRAVARRVVAPVPRPFDFGFSAQRPLVPLTAVGMFLDLTARDVVALIEEGKLRWAFDVRSATAARREVRVLRQSLFEYIGLQARDPAPHDGEDAEFPGIMDLILPKGIILSPAVFQPSQAHSGKPADQRFHLKLRLPPDSLRNMLFPQGTRVAGHRDREVLFVPEPARPQFDQGEFVAGGEFPARPQSLAADHARERHRIPERAEDVLSRKPRTPPADPEHAPARSEGAGLSRIIIGLAALFFLSAALGSLATGFRTRLWRWLAGRAKCARRLATQTRTIRSTQTTLAGIPVVRKPNPNQSNDQPH